MADLAGQLKRYCRQIEGDLALYCQTDLRDLFRPNGGASRLTWRRLDILLDALPGHGQWKTAIRDDLDEETLRELIARPRKGHGPWSHSDLLAGRQIDLLGIIAYRLGAFEQPPAPYDRPGVFAKRRKANDAVRAQIRAIAEEHARLHGYDLDAPEGA